MLIHILNGDCLLDQLKKTNVDGEIIVCRECLIDGSLEGNTNIEFWKTRKNYVKETYGADDYFQKVVTEFEKIINITGDFEINLWFENDLFCQANMWYVISLIAKLKDQNKVYRIFPIIKKTNDIWKGFSISNSEMLEESLKNRIQFSKTDIELGCNLWNAYKMNDLIELQDLSKSNSDCFQKLEEVCKAHSERFPENSDPGRPKKVLKEIIDNDSTNFHQIFNEFSKREGIYGFGDSQVKVMLNEIEDK